jgi:predicted anti-sigma-YlaC factor YlaD
MPEFDPGVLPEECQQLLFNVWDYLDGQLSEEMTAALRAHIASCEQCTAYESFQASFLAAMRGYRETATTRPATKEAVIDSLAAMGFAVPPPRGT